MGSKITVRQFVDSEFKVRESYTTVRKRLFDSRAFVEVTSDKKQKLLFNKSDILMVTPAEVTGTVKKKKK